MRIENADYCAVFRIKTTTVTLRASVNSEPATSHRFMHEKVGGQTTLLDPAIEKVGGQLTPLTPCFRGLCFDAHCCHTGTAIKHPVSDRVKPSFVISDIRTL